MSLRPILLRRHEVDAASDLGEARRERRGRIERPAILSIGVGVGLVGATFILYAQLTASHFLGDAYYYLSAGERLNAGHPLYSLSAGDRVVAVLPPFWTAPSVSPPFLGALWRPLAALPRDLGVDLWWLLCIAALASSITFLVGRRPLAGGIALSLLCIPIAMEAGLGNVNGLLLAGSIATWRWRERPWVGVVVGLMISAKVWPAAMVVWLFGQKRMWPIAVAAGTVAVCGLVGLVGAGWSNNVAYLSVGRSVHPSAYSLTWLLGLPWLWIACLVVGLATTWLSRNHPDWSFRLAVLTMVFGNPVANPNTYALLMALLVGPRQGRAERLSAHELRTEGTSGDAGGTRSTDGARPGASTTSR